MFEYTFLQNFCASQNHSKHDPLFSGNAIQKIWAALKKSKNHVTNTVHFS